MIREIFSQKDELCLVLGRELEILEEIKGLTDEQTRQVEMDDMDELGKVLKKRQECIEKINGLHQEREPLMQSYESSESDETIENLLNKSKQLLEACKKANDSNINLLQYKSQEQANKIEAQSAKRKGIGGYAQAVPNSSGMFDRKT